MIFIIVLVFPVLIMPMAPPKSVLAAQQKELFEAIRKGNEQEVDKYIANKGNLNIVEEDGLTPLNFALVLNNDAIALKLIDVGSNVFTFDKDGKSPFLRAIFYNRVRDNSKVIRAILDKGIDVNAVIDSDNDTPLHAAVRYASPEIVQLLLSRGANITARNKNNRTPVGVAESLLIDPKRRPIYEILKKALEDRQKKYTKKWQDAMTKN